MKRYHFLLGLPDVPLPEGYIALSHTNHAKEQAATDKFGPLHLPKTITASRFKVIEVTTYDDGSLRSVVLRGDSDKPEVDLVLVLRPTKAKSVWRVVTCWGNSIYDDHPTLRTAVYERVAS